MKILQFLYLKLALQVLTAYFIIFTGFSVKNVGHIGLANEELNYKLL